VDEANPFEVFLTDAQAQAALEHLRQMFGFETRTTCVPNDPITSAFHEGQRTVIVYLMRVIRTGRAERPAEVQTKGA
jgi:hypothetical protein